MNSVQISETVNLTIRGAYINGRWTPPAEGKTRIISCPADGRKVAEVAECTSADAAAAVASARTAFDDGAWPGTSEKERGRVLLRGGHGTSTTTG